jgi:hypothetical protein
VSAESGGGCNTYPDSESRTLKLEKYSPSPSPLCVQVASVVGDCSVVSAVPCVAPEWAILHVFPAVPLCLLTPQPPTPLLRRHERPGRGRQQRARAALHDCDAVFTMQRRRPCGVSAAARPHAAKLSAHSRLRRGLRGSTGAFAVAMWVVRGAVEEHTSRVSVQSGARRRPAGGAVACVAALRAHTQRLRSDNSRRVCARSACCSRCCCLLLELPGRGKALPRRR